MNNRLLTDSRMSRWAMFCLMSTFVSGTLSAAGLQTPLEATQFRSLPNNAAIVDFLDRLAGEYTNTRRIHVGKSSQGRPIEGLLISPNPAFLNVAAYKPNVDSERLRLMLVSGAHGEESAGPEALQIIARELLGGELKALARDMDIIVVPNVSPDGRDLGTRENGVGVNINTDYILLTQPESQALSAMLNRFRPDAVLDIHESAAYKEDSLATQGYVTYFDIQFEVGFEPNIDRRLREFGVKEFLPNLLKRAERNGLNARRYILEIRDVEAPVTHGGITLRNFRNYSGSSNCFSTLVEGRIDPPGGDYPTPGNIRERTEELSAAIRTYIEQAHAMRDSIKQKVSAARTDWQGPESDGSLALKSEYALDPEQPRIKIPLQKIDTGERLKKEFDYHGRVVTLEKLAPPPAYLITDDQDNVAELLERHGLKVERVKKAATYPGVRRTVEALQITPPAPEQRRFGVALELKSKPENIAAKPGDLLVSLDQPLGRMAPLLLEPKSTTSIYQEPEYLDMLKRNPFFVYPLSADPLKSDNSSPRVR